MLAHLGNRMFVRFGQGRRLRRSSLDKRPGGAGEVGREIEGPMAIVILGGLVTSPALNLLVLPTLALRYGKFTVQREA